MQRALAAIVVLTILAAVYIRSRRLPPPLPAAGPCARDSDCPYPQTCAGGACVAAGLPALLAEAQAAAAALYSTIGSAVGEIGSTAFNVASLVGDAGPQLLPPALGAAAAAALGAAAAALGTYASALQRAGCPPAAAASQSCGYYAAVAALTPQAPPGKIYAVAAMAASAAAAAPAVVGGFAPVDAARGNLAAARSAAGQAGQFINGDVAVWAPLVAADRAQLAGYPAAITGAAGAMRRTGAALQSYLR